MRRRTLLLLFVLASLLRGAHVEPEEGYLKTRQKGVEIIAAGTYADEIPALNAFMQQLMPRYEKSFGYRLDDTLYLTLASPKNQIPNAFSIQFPFNMQVDYIGGTLDPDYFAASSWIETILLHESAHNYQLNPKANTLSRLAHKVVRNTPVTWLLFAPLFPVPNVMESSYLLEGNAVLNESRFGNGGRLYSGALEAMAQMQARAGYLTPERLFNDHLFFPFNTHHYIVGGYFQLFLAGRYGIDRTNRYFLAYSRQWLPFFTNAVFRTHFGKSFEALTADFRDWMRRRGSGFRVTGGEVLARSKAPVELSRIGNQILFTTTDARSAPLLHTLTPSTQASGRQRLRHQVSETTLPSGKLFRVQGRYYARSFARTAPDRVTIGLFDADKILLPQSDSRVVECILPQKGMLYFDVNRSWQTPQLYLEGRFITQTQSSVICRGNDYYYFRQHAGNRTLYRNDRPLLTYRGYFGKVVDVDAQGGVLFVANSRYGSTLYRYSAGTIQRLCEGDDILDARLIDAGHAVVAVMGADGVLVQQVELHPRPAKVWERTLFFEKEQQRISWDKPAKSAAKKSQYRSYRAVENLRYSALEQFFEISDDNSVSFSLKAHFSDPLERNRLYGYLSRYDGETKVGVGYANSSYITPFGGECYYLLEQDDRKSSSRGFGFNAYWRYPLLSEGYRRSAFSLDYHLDAEKDSRSPLALSLYWQDRRQFGFALYPDRLQRYDLFVTDDRGDVAFGGAWHATYRIGEELYLGSAAQYARSGSRKAGSRERGIWIDNSDFASFQDPARFVMPSLRTERYVKEAAQGTLLLAKTLNFSRYYFSFPLSLRREVLYGKYRHFYLKAENMRHINEYTLGLRAETLLLHKLPLPVSIEWLYNDTVTDSRSFRLIFNLPY